MTSRPTKVIIIFPLCTPFFYPLTLDREVVFTFKTFKCHAEGKSEHHLRKIREKTINLKQREYQHSAFFSDIWWNVTMIIHYPCNILCFGSIMPYFVSLHEKLKWKQASWELCRRVHCCISRREHMGSAHNMRTGCSASADHCSVLSVVLYLESSEAPKHTNTHIQGWYLIRTFKNKTKNSLTMFQLYPAT